MTKVLLTAGVARNLEDGLWAEGFEVTPVASGAELRACTGSADAVVLGWRLPDLTAPAAIATLRDDGYAGAVVVLAERDAPADRVAALNAGADDCVAPPADLSEVVARLRAVLRRGQPAPVAVLRVGDLSVDRLARRVVRAGAEVEMTPTEFSVLEYLAGHSGRLVSKEQLLADVWRDFLYAESNVVAKYINMIRRKVERPGLPRLVHTVRGKGYVLSAEPVGLAACTAEPAVAGHAD